MDRRRFLVTSVAVVLAGPRVVDAQQTGKVYRIGLLAGPHPPILSHEGSGALGTLGYVERKNVAFEARAAGLARADQVIE